MSDPLERFPLLAGMPRTARLVLSERLEWIDVGEGSMLFHEGDDADALLLVLEGRIRLWSSRRDADGEIGAGTTIGALSLVVDGPREASARARSSCRLLRLSRDAFACLRSSEPDVACQLLEGILRENAVFTRDALAHLREREQARP